MSTKQIQHSTVHPILRVYIFFFLITSGLIGNLRWPKEFRFELLYNEGKL